MCHLKNVFLNFQIFGNISNIFLTFISSLNSLRSNNTCMIKFIDTWYIAQNMIYLVEFVFCCWGGVSNKFHSGQVGWKCCSSFSYLWFCIYLFYQLLRVKFWNSQLRLWIFMVLLSIVCFRFIYFEALLLYACLFLFLIGNSS